jgi:mono/diheme cytochrome c family protein
MINPAQIPPEVVEAAAKELLQQFLFLYLDEHRDPYEWQDLPEPAKERLREVARAAIAAGLAAWPGMFEEYMNDEDGGGASVCMILPQEASDE